MTNLQEMFQKEQNLYSITNERHRLSNVKRKRVAVLAKPRKCKPDAVNGFLQGVGLRDHAFFILETCVDKIL
jgi:hypothetical protein